MDKQILEAVRADAVKVYETIVNIHSQKYATEQTVRNRNINCFTGVGRVQITYPYICAGGISEAIRNDIDAGKKGDVKATPLARLLVAKSGALLGSFAEGCNFLKETTGIDISTSTLRKITLSVGEKNIKSIEKGNVEKLPLLKNTDQQVPKTLILSTDGTGIPCTKRDTQGRKGRNGEAKTREAKVFVAAQYNRLTKENEPLIKQNHRFYWTVQSNAEVFGRKIYRLVKKCCNTSIERIQFISDGATWIENIVQEHFPNVERTIDYYHACEYLHTIVEKIVSMQNVKSTYKRCKTILKENSGKVLLDYLNKKYHDKILQMDEEGKKAYSYIEKRVIHMEYGRLKKEGYYIGSGIVESACKSLIGSRCKLAGMHWRIKNAIKVTCIRSIYRSHLKLVA